MVQNNLLIPTMQSQGSGVAVAAGGTGQGNAFAAVISQLLCGTVLSAGTTGAGTQQTASGQQAAVLTQAQIQQLQSAGLQTGQILQVQQLQQSDLQILQGTAESLSESADTEQMTAGEALLNLVQQLQAAEESSGAPVTPQSTGQTVLQQALGILQTAETGDGEASVMTAAGKLLQVLPDTESDDSGSDTGSQGKGSETSAADPDPSLLGLLSGMLWQPQNPTAVQQAESGTQPVAVAGITGAVQTTAASQSVGIPQTQSGTDTVQPETTAAEPQSSSAAKPQVSSVQAQSSGTVTADSTQSLPHTDDTANDAQKQLFTLQSGFREAVAKTKDLLQTGTEDRTDTKALDADALQAQLTTGHDLTLRFASAAGTSETGQAADTASVSTQIQTGLTENLKLGKHEFTIKLNPDNLGEITIKLTETDGKTTLHLFTASAETARTINSDLNALREAVKPMAVEVHEAVAQTSQSSSSGTQGFDLGSQLAQQQQQQQRTAQEQQGGKDYAQFLEQEDTEPSDAVQTLENSGLDTYI